jgi:membrane protease YdiL (CAAX protease family)
VITHFKVLIRRFIQFLRDPNHPDYPVVSTRQKLLDVCFYYLLISFVMSGVILWYPVEIAEKLGWFDELKEVDLKMSLTAKLFSMIIFAPLVEEGMFRFWLGSYRNKSYFVFLYYISSLLFGYVHIFNYHLNDSHYFFIPFIIMTQIFGGFTLGYIRIIYGFWYGVLLHALFNVLGVICEYTIGFDL